jgi:hypothetical protein
MSSHESEAKHAFHKEIESQINGAVAKLEALRARAENVKADAAAVKAFAELLVKKQSIEHMLKELKKSEGHEWEQSKTALVARIAEFETSVKGIESKAKAKAKAS